ncbi:unnamed protein product, partial [Gongylonema pulchrum]|uniref:Flagellar protein n=1 Tax=Gongylonema pulchrum TaxID=637853 RepID=A0A183E476_9BILA
IAGNGDGKKDNKKKKPEKEEKKLDREKKKSGEDLKPAPTQISKNEEMYDNFEKFYSQH